MWSKNVIVVDAAYLDRVALDLIVNFESMINRSLPKVDLCHWLDCIALDSGLREGENEIQVLFVYDKSQVVMEHFSPSHLKNELDGQAFKDHLGEFTFYAVPVENMATTDDCFVDVVTMLLEAKETQKLMLIPDPASLMPNLRTAFQNKEPKDTTFFVMEPQGNGGFKQEILGYSLMSALGIKSEELM